MKDFIINLLYIEEKDIDDMTFNSPKKTEVSVKTVFPLKFDLLNN